MDRDEAAWAVYDAAVRSGLTDLPEPHRSQSKTSLQYGYSFVYFGAAGYRARPEGVGSMGETTCGGRYGDPGWVDDCVAVLQLGRTIECGKGVGMDTICQRIHWQTVDYSLAYLPERISKDDLWDLDPDYQRGRVWTHRQKILFLGFFLENGRMPLIFLQEWDWTLSKPYEVVDGKQRLTALLEFVRGEVPAELSDGRLVWWKDFNERDRRQVPSIKCAIVKLPDRTSILRFYIKLNRGGTVHTDAEIARVQRLLEVEEGKA